MLDVDVIRLQKPQRGSNNEELSWVWYPSLSPSSGYTHTTSRTFTHPQLFLVATCYHAHSLTCSLFPLIRFATSSFPVSLLLCQIISYSTHARGVYWPTYSIPSESCLVRDRLTCSRAQAFLYLSETNLLLCTLSSPPAADEHRERSSLQPSPHTG